MNIPETKKIDLDLINAAQYGDINEIQSLLKKGANPKAVDENERTALMLAAMWGKIKAIEILLPLSDIKAKDKTGKTAIQMARIMGYRKVMDTFKIYEGKEELYKKIKDLEEKLEASKKSDNHHKSLLKKVIHRSQNQQEDLKAADARISEITTEKKIVEGKFNKFKFRKDKIQKRIDEIAKRENAKIQPIVDTLQAVVEMKKEFER